MTRATALPDLPIRIVAGEGTGVGTIKPYTGARTERALKSLLTRERVGGQRWARAEINIGYDELGAQIWQRMDLTDAD